jgi:galactokinase
MDQTDGKSGSASTAGPDPAEGFRERFGSRPSFLARAPGRVNLIGEHTDYNGLPVLPMALQKEVRIAFCPRQDGVVRVHNVEPEFPSRTFELSPEIPPDGRGDWGNYLKAPCQSLARRFGSLNGIDALVSSTVPVASGLSSSSALVIALSKALLHANDLEVPTLDLADAMARAERYTGTQGGGMDQAISLGGMAGHASRIEFDPLAMTTIPVPDTWRFVVANTMVRAEKSGEAQAVYNARRRECGQALEALWARREGGELTPPTRGETISYRALIEPVPVAELVALGNQLLDHPLRARFRHVVTEGVRVYEAERAMRDDDPEAFGTLMDASHESLAVDYEVSSPELDRLVALAKEGGAAGARLTGAGLGGCIVALAAEDRAEEVMRSLAAGYFRGMDRSRPLREVLFFAEPSQGASVEAY